MNKIKIDKESLLKYIKEGKQDWELAKIYGCSERTISRRKVEYSLSGLALLNKKKTVKKTEQQKVGRNDPCWCGSGKKFKKCHGKN